MKAVKTWPESLLVRDIPVFLGFANFDQRFIQGLNSILASLSSMFKTISAGTLSSTNIRKCIEINNSGLGDSDQVGDVGGNLSKFNPSGTYFFTPESSIVFIYLRKTFIKAPIFNYFDWKHYIQIETDASVFAIS